MTAGDEVKARVRARVARLRARRKRGTHCLSIRVTADDVDRFVSAGYLDPADQDDRQTQGLYASRISSLLVRDSRTSSANGALAGMSGRTTPE